MMRYLLVVTIVWAAGCGSVAALKGGTGGAGGAANDGSVAGGDAGQGGTAGTNGRGGNGGAANRCVIGSSAVGSCTL